MSDHSASGMGRRQVLATLAGGAVALAGCSAEFEGAPSMDDVDGEPSLRSWESTIVTVGNAGLLDQVDDADDLIERALDYWSGNAEEYLDHPADFEYVPEGEDQDILVEFLEQVTGCDVDHDGEIAGCAPYLEDQSVPDGVTARIEVQAEAEDTLDTIKHELGHVLGLGHDDEPQSLMSNDLADRIENYEAKSAISEAYSEGIEAYNEGVLVHQSGRTNWKHIEYPEAEADMRTAADHFGSAAEAFDRGRQRAADIDKSEVSGMLGRAHERSSMFETASEQLAVAMAAYDDGDTDRGTEKEAAYETTYNEARQVEMPDGDHLYALLGLD